MDLHKVKERAMARALVEQKCILIELAGGRVDRFAYSIFGCWVD